MSISNNYLKYLNHFHKTDTLFNFHQKNSNVVALRHDVDHSIDAALEMAFFENYHGYKSTYFLLPFAPYWNSEDFFKKVLQIQKFGHEIGIHFNGISDWIELRTDDIFLDFENQIKEFKKHNIDVNGISSHGDGLCYKFNYINYWSFSNLKPDNPKLSENGRTAEGVFDLSATRSINYPKNEFLTRKDGKVFHFWSIDYKKLNIDYHAWHLNFDKYYSDSGGSWKRTGDPINSDLKNTKTQVLIHPEYWLEKTKLYFFLGTARSGSTWLTKILNESTNITARHEYLLNQDFFNKKSNFKNTHKVVMLENNKSIVKQKFIKFWEEVNSSKHDIAEVNIYLENFLPQLKKIFPDATYIFIKRDIKEIASSLMNRGWYEKYPDPARPRIKKPINNLLNFNGLNLANKQFFRILNYIIQVRGNLNNKCNDLIDMNKAFQDKDYLKEKLYKHGIYLYPQLIKNYNKKINLNKNNNYPQYHKWPNEHRLIYKKALSGLDKFNLNKKNNNYSQIMIKDVNFNNIYRSYISNFNALPLNILLKKLLSNNIAIRIKVNIIVNVKSLGDRKIPIFLNEYSLKSKVYKRNILFISNTEKQYFYEAILHPRTKFLNFSIPRNNLIKLNFTKFTYKIFLYNL